MILRESELLLIGLNIAALAALALALLGIAELLERMDRLKPRIVYVHRGGRDDASEPVPIRRSPPEPAA